MLEGQYWKSAPMIHDRRSQFCDKWTKIAENCANGREMGHKMCEEEKHMRINKDEVMD